MIHSVFTSLRVSVKLEGPLSMPITRLEGFRARYLPLHADRFCKNVLQIFEYPSSSRKFFGQVCKIDFEFEGSY